MELQRYLMPIVRWWWLLVAATVIAGVSSFLVVRQQPPIYQANATLMIGSMIQDPNPNSGEFYLVQQLASAYADMGNRELIKSKTMVALNLTALPEILVQPIPSSSLIGINVMDSDPLRAQVVANEIANQLILSSPTGVKTGEEDRLQFVNDQLDILETQIKETNDETAKLQRQLGDLTSARQIADMQAQITAQHEKLNSLQANYASLLSTTQRGAVNTLSLIEPAGLPVVPIGPNKTMTVLVACGIRLLLATLAAYGMEALDDTYKTGEEISEALNVPVLGYIPFIKEGNNQWTYADQFPRSPVSDAFRILRTNLDFIAAVKPFHTVLITGPDPGIGKSVVATNLALILSHSEKRVILVDADLRRPKLSISLNIEEKAGISDICLGRTSLLDALIPWQNGNTIAKDREELEAARKNKEQMIGGKSDDRLIHILQAGTIPPNPTEILSSSTFSKLLTEIAHYSDMVIVDSPPLFLPDASVLLGKTDGVILITEIGHTRRSSLRNAKSQIERSGARFLGVVVNRFHTTNEKYY